MSSAASARETQWPWQWLRPGEVIRRRLADDEWFGVRSSAAWLGVAQGTAAVFLEQPEVSFATVSMALLAAPLGALWGCAFVWTLAYLLRLVGSWWGGYAQGKQMRTVAAWALVPLTIGIGVMTVIVVMFSQPATFDFEVGFIEGERSVPAMIAAGTSLALALLWSIRSLVLGTRVAQQLSWPRAFAIVSTALTFVGLICFVLPAFVLTT